MYRISSLNNTYTSYNNAYFDSNKTATLVYQNNIGNTNTTTISSYVCQEDGDYYIFAYAISGGSANTHSVSYTFSCDGDNILTLNLGKNKNFATYKNYMYFYHYVCSKGDIIQLAHKAYDSDTVRKTGTSGIFIIH